MCFTYASAVASGMISRVCLRRVALAVSRYYLRVLLGVEVTTVLMNSLSILGVYHTFGVLSSLLLFVTVFVSC